MEAIAPAIAAAATRPLATVARPAPAPDPVDRVVRAALDRGDAHGALTAVMERYGDSIYHYCRRMVGEDRAPDAHQQTFVNAFKGLARFDGRSSVATWLFAIARRHCYDVGRDLGRRRARDPGEAGDVDLVADPGPAPGEQLDDARRLAALARCIDALAPAARSAVLLRYQEGFRYEEMVSMLDEPANTIGKRVARAVAALRTCVERWMGEDR